MPAQQQRLGDCDLPRCGFRFLAGWEAYPIVHPYALFPNGPVAGVNSTAPQLALRQPPRAHQAPS